MTLNEVGQTVQGLEADAMVRNLQESGIEVASPNAVVGELARENNLTPHEVYAAATGGGQGGRQGAGNRRFSGSSGGRGGYGIGRLTLRQYCDEQGLDVETALKRLKESNVQAKPDTSIRDIADSAGLHPSVIRDILGR